MKDKSYFIQFHRFIMQEINKSNNNLTYSRDTKHPAINLELGWENKKDKPFFSNMLVTTQSEDFVVIKIVDDKYESIDCKLENLCMIHNATKTIKFKQNVNQSYKFSIDSSKAISTYIALDRKPELKDYFMGNKGSIRLIEMQAKAKLVNWPFFAGVIGLKPTKDNEFYKYLIDNIAFYGDDIKDMKDSYFVIDLQYQKFKSENFNELHQGAQKLHGSSYSDTFLGVKSPDSMWASNKIFDSVSDKANTDNKLNTNFVYEHASFGDFKSEDGDVNNNKSFKVAGSLCIVSDLEDNVLILMKDYDKVIKRIAQIACRTDDIYKCEQFTKKKTEKLFNEVMPNWYMDLDSISSVDKDLITESQDSLYDSFVKKFLKFHDTIQGTKHSQLLDDVELRKNTIKPIQKRRLTIKPKSLFEINEEGWIVPFIADPSHIGNRKNLDGAYGCPDGTSFIVGSKFLTHFALKIKIHLEDKLDPTSNKVYYQLYDPDEESPYYILWYIIVYMVAVFGIVIWFIIALILKYKRKAKENLDNDDKDFVDRDDKYGDHIIFNDIRHKQGQKDTIEKSTGIWDSRIRDYRNSRGPMTSIQRDANKIDQFNQDKTFRDNRHN